MICAKGVFRSARLKNFKILLEKGNLSDMLTAYVREHPEVDIEIIIPHEENILNVLRFVECK